MTPRSSRLSQAIRPRLAANGAGGMPAVPGGTALPNDRLVTPAGTTLDLGDFPIGVAVSPDGNLLVASNSGQGSGLNSGFGSYCSYPACPYANPAEPLLTATLGYSTTPTYDDSLSVVNLRTNQTTQVTAVPTSYDPNNRQFNFFYAGVAFSPDGAHLYASGGGNDAVYDFPVQNDVVGPAPSRTVTLTDTVQNQPPLIYYGPGHAFTKGLAVTPDGRYLLITHEFQNSLDIVDTHTFSATQQLALSAPAAVGGAYPYGVVVSHDGSTAYVAEQGLNAIAVIHLAGGIGTLAMTVTVGDHPTNLALSPDGTQLYVANANDDTLSILTINANGVPTLATTIVLHALPGEQLGSTPNAVAVSPDGQRLYVTLAGDDAVAVLGTAQSFAASGSAASGSAGGSPASSAGPSLARAVPGGRSPGIATVRTTAGAGGPHALPAPPPQDWVVGGMIPAGWYPSAVATSNDGGSVYIVSAKGLGSRYVPPFAPFPLPGAIPTSFYYDGNNMPGLLQIVPAPDGPTLLQMLRAVQRDILHATLADVSRTPHNPIPMETITGTTSLTTTVTTPISYVIEIVRENRTFDQVLGDLGVDEGRGITSTDPINGYPGYAIFGRAYTPNAHALLGDPAAPGTPYTAYASSDAFYSDGEASIQGHWWTTAATVNDYVEKTWVQYYSSRYHFQDPVAAIAQPEHCSLFQSAYARQQANPPGTFTWRNYGELVGLKIDVPLIHFPVGSDNPPCSVSWLHNSDLSLPILDSTINLDHDDRAVAHAFLEDIGLGDDGRVIDRSRRLSNFSYITMGGDHTGGLSFKDTPRARVAQNDAGLGLLVAALSRSPYWAHTAIFVMEDDSQDGLDHLDGHRNVLYVISPYARHVGVDGKPGYISHRRYSQASVVKTIELLLGLPYLSTYDQNASPLYDLFQDKDGTPGHTLTPADLAPFTLQPAPGWIDETSSQYAQSLGPQGRVLLAASRRLNLSGMDRAGPMLEIIAWELARPHAPVPAQLQRELRAWQQAQATGHGSSGDG